jgi:CheY-like chemotaxis protein
MTDKKTILLVDDNEADNVYHSIVLRRCNLVGDIGAVESGTAGLHYLQHVSKRWPHLILVDINMPGMDGFEFIRQLDTLAPPAFCKVAVLTSSDADRDRDRASQLPRICAYVIKPLTIPSLVQLLVE